MRIFITKCNDQDDSNDGLHEIRDGKEDNDVEEAKDEVAYVMKVDTIQC